MSGQPGRAGEGPRFNPRISSAPGEPLTVEVDLPEDPATGRPSDADMFAAMAEAAELVFPGLLDGPDEGEPLPLPPRLLDL